MSGWSEKVPVTHLAKAFLYSEARYRRGVVLSALIVELDGEDALRGP